MNRVCVVKLCECCVLYVCMGCNEGTWEEEEAWEVSSDGGTTVGKKFIYLLLIYLSLFIYLLFAMCGFDFISGD